MKISEIMTRTPRTIGPDKSLKECARVLTQAHVNGLIVVEGEKVVGVITKADIFKSILPSYSDLLEDEQHLADFEYIEDRIHRLSEMKARDIMGTPPIIVSSDMPLVKAGSLMILRRVKQLPVVDNERLSGIVTLTDIVKYFGEKVK
jgi:CBS domain-containing protein